MAAGKYKYEGVNSEGKKVEGEIEGKDERQVKRLLRRQGDQGKESCCSQSVRR